MKIKEISVSAVFVAAALVIYIIESQFTIPFFLPGVKLGLANSVTLVTLKLWDKKHSAFILAVRIVLSAFIGSNVSALLYSACGGVCAFLAMSIFFRLSGKRYIVAASELGAVFHMLGQLAVASFVLKSVSVFAYFPVMLVSGTVGAAVVGICSCGIVKNHYLKELFGGLS